MFGSDGPVRQAEIWTPPVSAYEVLIANGRRSLTKNADHYYSSVCLAFFKLGCTTGQSGTASQR